MDQLTAVMLANGGYGDSWNTCPHGRILVLAGWCIDAYWQCFHLRYQSKPADWCWGDSGHTEPEECSGDCLCLVSRCWRPSWARPRERSELCVNLLWNNFIMQIQEIARQRATSPHFSLLIIWHPESGSINLVDVSGFEAAASASRT